MKTCDKYMPPPDNKIRFFQDHAIWEGLPEIEFNVEEIDESSVELWADGFGGGIKDRPGKYGNGSIHIHKDLITQ